MKIDYNKKCNCLHLIADKDKVITVYRPSKDIKGYHSSKSLFCSAAADIDVYHEITDEQDAEYKKQREDAVSAMLKKKGLE